MDIKKILIIAAVLILAAGVLYGFLRPARIIETTRIDTKLVEKLKKDIERISSQAWASAENYRKQIAAETSSQRTLDKDTEIVETFNAEGKLASRITRKRETATSARTSTTASTATSSSTASGSASTAERDRTESSSTASSSTQTKTDTQNYKAFSLGAGITTEGQPLASGSITFFNTIEAQGYIQIKPSLPINGGAIVSLRF
jgi:hypothetical protein